MLGGNAAALYGFDLDALAPVAAEVGPPVDEVARPLAARRDPRRGATSARPSSASHATASNRAQ